VKLHLAHSLARCQEWERNKTQLSVKNDDSHHACEQSFVESQLRKIDPLNHTKRHEPCHYFSRCILCDLVDHISRPSQMSSKAEIQTLPNPY